MRATRKSLQPRETRIVVVFVCFLVALFVLLALLLYRRAYGRFPWQSRLPDQVSACGRDYIYPDSRHPLRRAEAAHEAGPLAEVGRTSGWVRTLPVWGHYDHGRDAAGIRCGYAVFVRTGADRFIAYEISGGP